MFDLSEGEKSVRKLSEHRRADAHYYCLKAGMVIDVNMLTCRYHRAVIMLKFRRAHSLYIYLTKKDFDYAAAGKSAVKLFLYLLAELFITVHIRKILFLHP